MNTEEVIINKKYILEKTIAAEVNKFKAENNLMDYRVEIFGKDIEATDSQTNGRAFLFDIGLKFIKTTEL